MWTKVNIIGKLYFSGFETLQVLACKCIDEETRSFGTRCHFLFASLTSFRTQDRAVLLASSNLQAHQQRDLLAQDPLVFFICKTCKFRDPNINLYFAVGNIHGHKR